MCDKVRTKPAWSTLHFLWPQKPLESLEALYWFFDVHLTTVLLVGVSISWPTRLVAGCQKQQWWRSFVCAFLKKENVIIFTRHMATLLKLLEENKARCWLNTEVPFNYYSRKVWISNMHAVFYENKSNNLKEFLLFFPAFVYFSLLLFIFPVV